MLILENKLYKELNKKRIDWEKVESIIKENKDYINEFEDEDCSLSECYHCFYQKGREALKLTKLFLEYGFDVSANEGKNGASCLEGLCWSLHDQYVLEIAELLLKIGADSTICFDEEDENGVLDSIAWKSGDWMTGEYENANLFEAYYELVERAQNNKEYAIEVTDVSSDFTSIIGAKIKGLRFQSNSQARLDFDNGISLLIAGKDDLANDELESWLSIVETKRPQLPPVGTRINRVCFPGQVIHGNNFQYYEESLLILDFSDEVYSLYSHEQQEYAVSTIRIERFNKEMIKNIKRGLDLHNLVLEEIHYRGEAIEWIRISCDEGMFYINPAGFTSVGFYLAPYEIDNPGEVSTWTKGLIPLQFSGTEDWRR